MYVERDTQVHSLNHYCIGKAIIITYSVCVFVALGIQHATRMCPVTLSSVACPGITCFSTSSHKRHDFRGGGVTELTVCFDFLY